MNFSMSLLRRLGMASLCLWITAAVALAQPSITTRSAVNVLSTTATLRADINPNGTATQYMFAYGTTKNYGKTTPVSRLSGGNQVQTVTADIGSLAPNTTYHFCIMANHSGKSLVYGQDMTFTTTAPGTEPTAVTLDASDIESSGVVLRGRVYPGGMPTSCAFDYGLTDACSESTEWFSVAAGVQPVDVSVTLANLKPETSYYFRVKATNTEGSSKGDLKKFTTAKEVVYPENPIAVSLSSYDFGEVEIGHGGRFSLTFTNTSNVEVNLETFYLHNNFSTDWHGGILQAKETKDVTVTFYPFVSGPAKDSQTLTATCGPNTQSINLSFSGTGYLCREGVEAVDLGLSVKWADRNLGASTPERNGVFFAWGATEPGTYYGWPSYCYGTGSFNKVTKYCTNEEYGPVDNRIELELDDDAAFQWLGEGWRMPSLQQVEELRNECTWKWDDVRLGYLVTGPNDQSIFLPAAGGGDESMYVFGGEQGYYWTRSLDVSSSMEAEAMTFGDGDVGLINMRSMGFAIRPVYENEEEKCAITIPNPTLDFGTMAVSESKTMSFIIANVSNKPVTINTLPSSGGSRYGHYHLDWTGGVIDAGASQTVNITYTADAAVDKDEDSFDVTYQGMPEGFEITVSFCASVYEKEDPDELCYVDLGLPSGTLWGDRNVGAEAPEKHGYHLAWGELQEKEYYEVGNYFDSDYSIYNATTGLTELRAEDDAACFYCGPEWRTPSVEQFEELLAQCTWNRVERHGQPGWEATGPNGNTIFLPDADTQKPRDPMVAASFVYYWTRNLLPDNAQEAYRAVFKTSVWSDIDGESGVDLWSYFEGWSRAGCGVVRPVVGGTPVKPEVSISVTPDALDFGTMTVGESKTMSFAITNESSYVVEVQCSASGGSRYGDFTTDWHNGQLAPQTSQIVNVTYTATGIVDKDEISIVVSVYANSSLMEEIRVLGTVTNQAKSDPVGPELDTRTHLMLWGKDGSKMLFTLNDKPRVEFRSGKMVITSRSSVTEYDTKNLSKITYENLLPENIEEQDGKSNLPFSRNGETLTFIPGDKDQLVRILSVNGVILQSIIVRKYEPVSMPIDLFDAGIYLIDVDGVTYKISKR